MHTSLAAYIESQLSGAPLSLAPTQAPPPDLLTSIRDEMHVKADNLCIDDEIRMNIQRKFDKSTRMEEIRRANNELYAIFMAPTTTMSTNPHVTQLDMHLRCMYDKVTGSLNAWVRDCLPNNDQILWRQTLETMENIIKRGKPRAKLFLFLSMLKNDPQFAQYFITPRPDLGKAAPIGNMSVEFYQNAFLRGTVLHHFQQIQLNKGLDVDEAIGRIQYEFCVGVIQQDENREHDPDLACLPALNHSFELRSKLQSATRFRPDQPS
jgi:hypothetical protein